MDVCRIQFKSAGKKYYFNPGDIKVAPGDKVVVETVRGVELGVVCGELVPCPKELQTDIKPVVRIANAKDIENYEKNITQERPACQKIQSKIRKNELDMKLLGCEYTLDRQKLLIYFESEGRVDFRQLVRDLAEEFKMRIELRQIGARDGAKMLGGLGPCGLVTCCKTFIGEFDNVSIKMAKNQNLSLNPQKISGTCGKLLCCIKYENEVYVELRKDMPDLNDTVKTDDGDAKVLAVDVLKRQIKVRYFTDGTFAYLPLDQVKFVKKVKNNNSNQNAKSDTGVQ